MMNGLPSRDTDDKSISTQGKGVFANTPDDMHK